MDRGASWALKSMGLQKSDMTERLTHTHTWFLYGFPPGSVVKNLPAKQERWVPSQGLEDTLKKEMTIHSSVLAWEIPWTDEPGKLQSMESQSQRVRQDLVTKQKQIIHNCTTEELLSEVISMITIQIK